MKKLFLAVALLAATFRTPAQPVVGFSSFLTGLTAPVDIVNAGDGSNRLFIVQQNGIVKLYSGGALLPTPFLDMSTLITYASGGEQGLLTIAFHPQYATNRYFFVYYNNPADSGELARYQTSATDPNVADPSSRVVLLTIPKPFTNHNGCKLNFGADGNLYFGTGDGGSGGDPYNNAQNLNSYLGKMLRINVDNFTTSPYYTVPATNPFVGVANTKPEIYQYGLRNPWRWSFDRQTHDMWIADVGQDALEEVDMIPAAATNGLNFGWRCYEANSSYDLSACGATPLTGKTFPIFQYGHNSAGGYSITGGLVYRGAQFPTLQGWYICADYVRPNGWLIKPNGTGGWTVGQQTNFPAGVVTFGDAEDGTLYMSTLSGTVYQVIVPNPLSIKLLSFGAGTEKGRDILSWHTTADPLLDRFEVEQSTDGSRFSTIGTLQPHTGSGDYIFSTTALPATRYYRLKMLYSSGRADYSYTVELAAAPPVAIAATMVTPGRLQITTPVPLESISIINAEGRTLERFAGVEAGVHVLEAGMVAPGFYVLRCRMQDKSVQSLRLVVY